MVTGYCVKCKKKDVQMNAPAIHQTKKGGFMAKGLALRAARRFAR